MSVLPGFRPLLAAAAITLFRIPATAAAVDPAVVGERLERLNAAVEALESGQGSQRRQIEDLGNTLHKVREDILQRGTQRPWADEIKRQNEDLKRLASAIEEVDRKRVADHKQVLDILADLRKAVAAAAEAPPARPPARPAPDRSDSPSPSGSGKDRDKPAKAPEPPEKYIEHVIGAGESLSLVLKGFNEEARKKGYQTLSVQQVMKFNRIADERRVPQGATLKLPLYPKPEKSAP